MQLQGKRPGSTFARTQATSGLPLRAPPGLLQQMLDVPPSHFSLPESKLTKAQSPLLLGLSTRSHPSIAQIFHLCFSYEAANE